MKKEKKLINKVKRLIRRAKLPRWLHRYGPKKYELFSHILALLVKQECKLGYRRTSRLLNGLGVKVPTYSALAKMNKRIDQKIWEMLLKLTNNSKIDIIAIDGSGMSRPLPSPHYYKRIDKPYPIEIPLKLSLAVDVKSRKIVSIRIRSKKRHDIMDVKYLLKRFSSNPKILVADKGYDAEWVHQLCKSIGIKTLIPMRDYGKRSKHNMFSLRRNGNKLFDYKTYYQREIVEAIIGAFKRKFGASVSSILARTRRAEIYCRAIMHNLNFFIIILFQRSRLKTKFL
jgi:hypothetical protein